MSDSSMAYRETTHNGVRYRLYGPNLWMSGTMPFDMQWIDVALVPLEARALELQLNPSGKL